MQIFNVNDFMAVLLCVYCTCSALVHVCQSAAVSRWTEIFSSYTSSAKTKLIQQLLNFKLCRTSFSSNDPFMFILEVTLGWEPLD